MRLSRGLSAPDSVGPGAGSHNKASGSWLYLGTGGLLAAFATAYIGYKRFYAPAPARKRKDDEERVWVPPPKAPVFPEKKPTEHTVLLPSMPIASLPTPFDTPFNVGYAAAEETKADSAPGTPTAFGLRDPPVASASAAWFDNPGGHVSSDGGRSSKARSDDLDSMRSIPGLLRSRGSEASLHESLPELGAILGRGSYGKVFKGRWRGARVAVKIIEHSPDINSKIEGLRENMVSSNIQHPNVLITYTVMTLGQHGKVTGQQPGSLDSAHGSSGHAPQVAGEPPQPPPEDDRAVFEGIQETWLVSEFCDKGNLDRAVSGGRFHDKASGAPEMMSIYRCLLDIAAGMDYLHSLGVLHGDLKGGNVLMKSTSIYDDPRGFICKIGDFGLSRVLMHNSTHVSTGTYGTVSYCAPELLKEGKLTKAADVYSFAMMMWEMYTGTMLFRGMNSSQVFFKVLMGYRPPVPPDMPEAYRDLMMACWDAEPGNRPPFSDVVRFLRSTYYNSGEGTPRTSRRSLELNPWG